jgi:hypothetical protein
VSTLILEENMPSIAAIKAELVQIIEALESRKTAIDSLLASLTDTVQKLERLTPELLNIVGQPVPALPSPDTSENQHEFFRLHQASGRQTQFGRLALYFIGRENTPATVEEMRHAISASRSALTNMLYRTQKEAFISHPMPGGHPRLRGWSLRPEVFRAVVERMRRDQSEDA